MNRKRAQALLAAGLTALAGYVDALGFLQSGGTFVAFMSGNTTRIGAETGNGHPGAVTLTALVLVLFVTGAMLGHIVRKLTQTAPQAAVLATLTALLLLAALSFGAGRFTLALAFTTMAMGAENATFEKDGEVSIGLTYISSITVKIGDHLADALTGGRRWEWLKPARQVVSLLAGAAVGGVVYRTFGFAGIWAAVVASAAATIVTAVSPLPQKREEPAQQPG